MTDRMTNAKKPTAAMEFRKRPIVVEAFQWVGQDRNDWPTWAADDDRLEDICAVLIGVAAVGLKVWTAEGAIRASHGDWIIKGIQGELYPCKPDIFAATYDPLEPAAPVEDGEVAALRKAVEPWADHHGDMPDWDSPLFCVFDSGVDYAVNLLAKVLKVEDWEICDGTEEYDGDLGGTLLNIVLKTWPTDEHGDWIDLRDPANRQPPAADALVDQMPVNWELSWGEIDNDPSECAWRVHQRRGGYNDREWTLMATGETPSEAIRAALTKLQGGGKARRSYAVEQSGRAGRLHRSGQP